MKPLYTSILQEQPQDPTPSTPSNPTTIAHTPRQSPPLEARLYHCCWQNCGSILNNPGDVLRHISETHVNKCTQPDEQQGSRKRGNPGFECRWQNCDKGKFGSVRDLSRHALTHHLLPQHNPMNCPPAILQHHLDLITEAQNSLRSPTKKTRPSPEQSAEFSCSNELPSVASAAGSSVKSRMSLDFVLCAPTEDPTRSEPAEQPKTTQKRKKSLNEKRRQLMLNRKFRCQWRGCSAKCSSQRGLIQHLKNTHVKAVLALTSECERGPGLIPCLWRNCLDANTKYFAWDNIDTHFKQHVAESQRSSSSPNEPDGDMNGVTPSDTDEEMSSDVEAEEERPAQLSQPKHEARKALVAAQRLRVDEFLIWEDFGPKDLRDRQ